MKSEPKARQMFSISQMAMLKLRKAAWKNGMSMSTIVDHLVLYALDRSTIKPWIDELKALADIRREFLSYRKIGDEVKALAKIKESEVIKKEIMENHDVAILYTRIGDSIENILVTKNNRKVDIFTINLGQSDTPPIDNKLSVQ